MREIERLAAKIIAEHSDHVKKFFLSTQSPSSRGPNNPDWVTVYEFACQKLEGIKTDRLNQIIYEGRYLPFNDDLRAVMLVNAIDGIDKQEAVACLVAQVRQTVVNRLHPGH